MEAVELRFIDGIRGANDDVAQRLVYADWLEEGGGNVAAEFLRIDSDERRRLCEAPRALFIARVLPGEWREAVATRAAITLERELDPRGHALEHLARVGRTLERSEGSSAGEGDAWVSFSELLPPLHRNPQAICDLFEAASLMARVRHPNVARVVDFGRDPAACWVATEYLDGVSVWPLILESRRVPVGVACRIVLDAADGAHAVHAIRWTALPTRISPRDIYVTRDGSTRLADLIVPHVASPRRWAALAYMPPELARGAPATRRSDVFTLGIVLWELVTGRRLFARDGELDTLAAIMEGEVPGGCPKPIEPVVTRALASRPSARFLSALAFARALRPFAAPRAEVRDFIAPLLPPPIRPSGLGTTRVLERFAPLAESEIVEWDLDAIT